MNYSKFPDNDEPAMADQPSELDWAHRQGCVGDVLAELALRSRRRLRRRLLLGSTMMVVGLISLGILNRGPSTPLKVEPPSASHLVVDGPQKKLLPDGTIVHLAAQAELKMAYTAGIRRVILTAGTAQFEVFKDATRPFVVEAEGVKVRAVGTAFMVVLKAGGVDVLVTEGRVAVSPIDESKVETEGIQAASVGAGERLVYDFSSISTGAPQFKVDVMSRAQVESTIAWLVPRLEFSGMRLDEAVAMFNQHNQRQLVLASPALEGLRISGALRADNLPALLDMLHAGFGIQAEVQGEGAIFLRRD